MGFRQIISQIPYSFDNALGEVFQKGNLMPTYSKWICENQQLAFEEAK
jgi:hypothetical protein